MEPGIDLLRGALETLATLKMNVLLTDFMGTLADGLCKSGQLNEALVTVNQAIRRATGCGSTFDLAELLRIKAQILAATRQYGGDAAMNCLTEALAVAREQSALGLELRSTIAMARLLFERGQRNEARRMLTLVYDRFTEGFETADLRIACQLLKELA